MKIGVAAVAVEKTLTLCLTYAGADLWNMSNAQDSRVNVKIIQTKLDQFLYIYIGMAIELPHVIKMISAATDL